MDISAQHELFIEQFIELHNVRDAAVAAGFDASYGYKLFKKLRTQIDERLQDEMMMMQAQAIAVTKQSMDGKAIVPAVQAIKQRAAETTMDRGSLPKRQNLDVGVKEMPAVMVLPEKNPVVPSVDPVEPEED